MKRPKLEIHDALFREDPDNPFPSQLLPGETLVLERLRGSPHANLAQYHGVPPA